MRAKREFIPYGMLSLALDTIRRRPLRSLIAVLSISVALGGALVMVGTSEALEATLERGYASRRVDLIVLQANKSNPMTSRVDQALAPIIEGLAGVRRVQALLVDSLTLGSDRSMLVYGWPIDYTELQKQTAGGSSLDSGEVMIGRAAAELSGIRPGSEIELNLGTFRVVETFEGKSFFESGVIYMRLDDLQRLVGAPGRVTFLYLELQPGVSADERRRVSQGIERQYPSVRVLSAEEFLKDDQLARAMRGLGQVILLTSVLLSVLIVSTIMVLTVGERRAELAVLRAIGWSAARVASLVLLETSVIASCAAICGILLGWLGLQGALSYLRSEGIHAQAIFTMESGLLMLGAAVLVALLGAAIPVHHTMGIRVSEALREQ